MGNEIICEGCGQYESRCRCGMRIDKLDKELVEKVAEILQDRDNEAGECATSWSEGYKSTQDYYRKSAKKVIPIIREEKIK